MSTFVAGSITFAFLASIVDGGLAFRSGALPVDVWRIAAASYILASSVSVALVLLHLPFLAISDVLGRRGWIGRIGGCLVFATPAMVFAVHSFLELTHGQRISAHPHIALIRSAGSTLVAVGALFGLNVLESIIRAGIRSPQTKRRVALRLATRLALGAIVFALLVADHRVMPIRYPASHAFLWYASWIAAHIAFMSSIESAPKRSVAAIRLLASSVVAFAAVGCFWEPLDGRPTARSAAFRSTLFLKRFLYEKARWSGHRIAVARFDAIDLGTTPAIAPDTLDKICPDRRRMNVLAVSIDATRADRLMRGHDDRNLTPNIDALIGRGTWFREAWTPYPSTRAAFFSVFRALYPSATDTQHEILHPGSVPKGKHQVTIASLLRSLGHRTEAVVGLPRRMIDGFATPFADEFEYFNDFAGGKLPEEPPPGERITTAALAALDRDPVRPFFMWTHYFDPHHPWNPPTGERFGSAPADLYDAEIHYADEQLGILLDGLSARGLDRSTLVIIFADHGEALGERDRWYHASALDQIQLHIPLIIAIPGCAPRRIESPVDLCDVLPTITELLDIPLPYPVHGDSLLRYVIAGDPDEASRALYPAPRAFAELDEPTNVIASRLFAVREGKWKLILDAASRIAELYDLSTDPSEEHDLALTHAREVAHMSALLESYIAKVTEPLHLVESSRSVRTTSDEISIFRTALELGADVRIHRLLESWIRDGNARPKAVPLVEKAALARFATNVRLAALHWLELESQKGPSPALLARLAEDSDQDIAEEARFLLARASDGRVVEVDATPSVPSSLRALRNALTTQDGDALVAARMLVGSGSLDVADSLILAHDVLQHDGVHRAAVLSSMLDLEGGRDLIAGMARRGDVRLAREDEWRGVLERLLEGPDDLSWAAAALVSFPLTEDDRRELREGSGPKTPSTGTRLHGEEARIEVSRIDPQLSSGSHVLVEWCIDEVPDGFSGLEEFVMDVVAVDSRRKRLLAKAVPVPSLEWKQTPRRIRGLVRVAIPSDFDASRRIAVVAYRRD